MNHKFISKSFDKEGHIVMAFGSYDLLHIGHLYHLQYARNLGDYLIVGVASDGMVKREKGKDTVMSTYERLTLISSLEVVDGVFIEESNNKKEKYLTDMNVSTFVVGEEWLGHFDFLQDKINVVYLPRFPYISTSDIVKRIKEGGYRDD